MCEQYAFKQGRHANGPITKAKLAFLLHQQLIDRKALVFPVSAGLPYADYLYRWIARWQAKSVHAHGEA